MTGKSLIEQHKLLKDKYDVDNIDFKSIHYLQEKTSDPKTREDIELTIRNYAVINDHKMFLKFNAFNIKKSLPDMKDRNLPLYLNRGYTDEDEIVYTLAETIETSFIMPKIKILKTSFGEYESKTTPTQTK